MLAAVFAGGTLIGSTAGNALGAAIVPDEKKAFAELFSDTLRAGAVAWLLVHLGWFTRVGFTRPSQWRALWLASFPALLTLLFIAGSLGEADLSDPVHAALVLPQPLLTGFWEEGLTRGFLLFVLLAAALRSGRGAITAVLGSSAVFGLMHVINVVGADPGATASQVLYATFIGIGFAALLLRTNSLWLLVALHFLFNLPSALKPEESSSGFNAQGVLLALPLALYGLWLLRERRAGDAPVDAAPDGMRAPAARPS